SRVPLCRIRPRIEPVDLAFERPCRRRNHVRSPVPRESITCLTDAYCRLRLRLVALVDMDVLHCDLLLALAAMPIERIEQGGIGTGELVCLAQVLAKAILIS